MSEAAKSAEREMATRYGRAYLNGKMNETLKSFPVRTLMVCLTIWLVVTEVLVFDQLKFDAKAELLDQAARALRRPQLVVPDQRPLNRPDSTKLEQL